MVNSNEEKPAIRLVISPNWIGVVPDSFGDIDAPEKIIQ